MRDTIIIKPYRAAKYTAGFPNHKDNKKERKELRPVKEEEVKLEDL